MKIQADYLNLLIKPTNICNLKCKYCFNGNNTDEVQSFLRIEDLEKFLSISFQSSKIIQIVWHGGEPTLIGIEYFEKAFSIIAKLLKAYNNKVTQCIQTNAINLSQDWIDFLILNNVKIGTSYDGYLNELTRGKSVQYLKSMALLSKSSVNVGAICVVTKLTLNSILETYLDFNERRQSVNFRPIVLENDERNNNLLAVGVEDYCTKINNLFDFWLTDVNCQINVEPFTTYLQLLLGKPGKVCNMGACIGSWFCLEPNGNITPCNRSFPKKYTYGNIRSIDSFEQIYNSSAMANLLEQAIERRRKCANECDYFKYCNGGCNYEAFMGGNICDNDYFECRVFKTTFSHAKSQVSMLKNYKGINPKIEDIVRKINNC